MKGMLSCGKYYNPVTCILQFTTFPSNCEITIDGESFTNRSAGRRGEMTIWVTVDDHHFPVRCQ